MGSIAAFLRTLCIKCAVNLHGNAYPLQDRTGTIVAISERRQRTPRLVERAWRKLAGEPDCSRLAKETVRQIKMNNLAQHVAASVILAGALAPGAVFGEATEGEKLFALHVPRRRLGII